MLDTHSLKRIWSVTSSQCTSTAGKNLWDSSSSSSSSSRKDFKNLPSKMQYNRVSAMYLVDLLDDFILIRLDEALRRRQMSDTVQGRDAVSQCSTHVLHTQTANNIHHHGDPTEEKICTVNTCTALPSFFTSGQKACQDI